MGCQRQRERLQGAWTRHHRREVHPVLAAREPATLESWQQTGHDHTRLARSAWPDHRQQARLASAWRCRCEGMLERLPQFLNECLPAKEIGTILFGKRTQ